MMYAATLFFQVAAFAWALAWGVVLGCSLHMESKSSWHMVLQCNGLEELARFSLTPEQALSTSELVLTCGQEKSISPNGTHTHKRLFPNLDTIAIHGCGQKIVEILGFDFMRGEGRQQLLVLNLSNNGLTTLPWQYFRNMRVELVDLRGNNISCVECRNRWLRSVYLPSQKVTLLSEEVGWDVHSIYPLGLLPLRAILDSKFIATGCAKLLRARETCVRERVEFVSATANATLGSGLELECKLHSRSPNPLQRGGENPFYWPLSNEASDHLLRDGEGVVEWNRNGVAKLTLKKLNSNHLGTVACRCLHCVEPVFAITELRFNVPPTIRVENSENDDSAHLIVHGYPLTGLQLRVRRMDDNVTEKVAGISSRSNGDSIWPLFNGTIVLSYLGEHSFYFLKYFALDTHECAECIAHTTLKRGDYEFELCVEGGCSRTLYHLGRRNYPIVSTGQIVYHQTPKAARPHSVLAYILLIGLLIAFFLPLLLFLTSAMRRLLLRKKPALLARQSWIKGQTKQRRVSGDTEETSIPLSCSRSSAVVYTPAVSLLHVPTVAEGELCLKEHLGRGAFGEVYAAEWLGKKTSDISQQRVAVKILHAGTHFDAEMDKEAALLSKLSHPNVLRLHGVAHIDGRIALVLELMNMGNLKNYLRQRLPKCSDYSQFPAALLPTELLNIAVQVAVGLSYLVLQSIVHRDLAARNCLICGETDERIGSAALRPPITVKIADFGMSRRLYSDTIYYRMRDKKAALPVRWLPPECLSSGRFTHQSDMWAFGITLLEIFTYGDTPFGSLSNSEVCGAVVGGLRPDTSAIKCPLAEVVSIMTECWRENPTERISIADALLRLRSINC